MIDSVVAGIDMEEVVELTSRLVEIDTSNPPGNEELAARYLGGYLAEAGISVEYREVEPGRAYLIARLPGRERNGHLVFSGHLDVVPAREPGWEHDPFRATRVDGRLIGRGTADMKGGLAAMAAAMTALRRSGFVPRADLILAASIGEERGMTGALHMAGCGVLAGVDYLLVGEPTGLDICPAQRGALIFSLTVHGHGAHSSMPERGVSAISYMARAIVALEAHRFLYQHTDLLGAPSVNVGTIEGGVAANIVPDRCAVLGNIRLVAGQSWEAVETDVRAILDAVKRESELPVDIQLEARGVSACLTDLDHPLVQAVVEAVAAVSGRSPRIRGFTGGTEAGILCRAYGMPMTIFGPGKLEHAHQVNEYVDISELIQATQAYTLIASTLLG